MKHQTSPTHRLSLLQVLVVAVAYALVTMLADPYAVVPGLLDVRLGAGLVIPFSILFGVPAVIGVGLGVVLTELYHHTLAADTLVVIGSYLIFSYTAHLTWSFEAVPARVHQGRLWLEVAAVTLVSAAAAASFLAWGNEVLLYHPFYVTVGGTFVNHVLATLLVTPLVYGLTRADLLPSEVRNDTTWARTTETDTDGGTVGVFGVTIPVLWAVCGAIGSVGFRVGERIPDDTFQSRGVEPLQLVFHDLLGPGGQRVQIVFGVWMLVLLWACFLRVRQSGTHRWN